MNRLRAYLEADKGINSIFEIPKDEHINLGPFINQSESNIRLRFLSLCNNVFDTQIGGNLQHIKEIRSLTRRTLKEAKYYNLNTIEYLSLLIKLYLISNSYVNDFIYEDVDSFKNVFIYPEDVQRLVFRGVQNKEFDLIPSMYRNIKQRCHIDKHFIDSKYSESGLTDKYRNVFADSDLKPSFCSFMQHYAGFSPFIDFTESVAVASSFATTPVNRTLNDGAIYCLFKNNNTKCEEEYNIEFFPDKINLNDKIFGKNLWNLELDDFKVQYRTNKEQTNDRMKYQRGMFVDIHKCVFINNRLCFPSSEFNYFKICFSKESKEAIYQSIGRKYPEYLYENLMHPDNYFKIS